MKLKEYLETRKISKNIFKVIVLTVFVLSLNSLSYAYFTSTIEGEGKVSIGYSSSDTSFNSIGKTGGSKSINLEHTHTTKDHTLTIAEMPSHGHSLARITGSTGNNGDYLPYSNSSGIIHNNSGPLGDTGGSQPHNHGETTSSLSSLQSILNPYIVSAKWIRVS